MAHKNTVPAKPEASPKQTNPIKEAERLQRGLEKIDVRESVARSNMEERYQAERNALMEGASPTALRIIAAAKSEVE